MAVDHIFRRSRPGDSLALALLLAAVTTPAVCFAQQSADETVKSFTIAEGFQATLFASEPMISNPITMDVDTQGRVWVTEGMHYRRARKTPDIDKIKVLEDTDGDGRADKMTVFTSDLNAAMGVCVAGDKIYVPESPNIYVYEDADGDLKPDGPRKVFLTGFGGENHDHGVHSLIFGPDHKLYMTQGDSGYDVTGPDGKRIKFNWGAMIRCEGDGSQLEDIAVNFRNPFELAVDSFGNVWCSDNDNDGLKSTRLCWILEGGDYGWFGRPEDIRNPDGSFDPIHHWRADKPGFVPYVLITGFGAPCGIAFYEGTAFGPQYDGTLFHCDAGPREFRNFQLRKKTGIGYTAEQQNIITSTDNYFRPDDVCVAPDGSMYVSDWYDGGVGGHAYNDPQRGRIYRVTPTSGTLERREKPGPYDNDEDAIVALGSPNLATTYLARERLLQSGEAAVGKLKKLIAGNDARLKARALWLLDRIGGTGRELVKTELSSADPKFRALAVRILRRRAAEYENEILTALKDENAEVRREAALAIPELSSDTATEALVGLFEQYDGRDRYFLETLNIAARGREAEIFQRVVERPDATVDLRLVNLVRILRPEDATKFLASKLDAEGISADSRGALLAALGSVAAPEAGKSVAKLLTSKQATADVKRLALRSLGQKLPGPWVQLKESPEVTKGIAAVLQDPELQRDALEVVAQAGLNNFADDVVRLIVADNRQTQLKAMSVATRLMIDAAAGPLSEELKSNEPELREAALRALVTLQAADALSQLLTGSDADESLKTEAVDLLTRSSGGAVILLPLVEKEKLSKPLREKIIAAAAEHPDVNVRLLYEKFIPAEMRPKTLGQSFTSEDILKLSGNAERGKSVFLRSGAASCSRCHRVRGKGADIGPDLSLIGRKYERKALLETIMQPSAGIAPEFVPHVVETKRGKVFAGFVQEKSTDGIVLKTIEGDRIRLAASDIEEDIEQQTSLMPELVLKNVTAQDAADLLAYLASLQEGEVYATRFRAVGPFDNEKPEQRKTVYGPENNPGEFNGQAVYTGLGGKQVRWIEAKTRSYDGAPPAVDLTRLTERAKTRSENVIYYFAVVVNSTVEQPARLNVGSDDGIQVWLNGAQVHDHATKRALAPGQDKVDVTLKQGRNLLLLKLDQGNGPAGVMLSVETRGNVTFELP